MFSLYQYIYTQNLISMSININILISGLLHYCLLGNKYMAHTWEVNLLYL
jgi:hypothetical protein